MRRRSETRIHLSKDSIQETLCPTLASHAVR